MLFPLHCQTGRVQSEDAQAHLDRQLYKVLLPTQAFLFCSSHLTAVAILIRASSSPNSHTPPRNGGKSDRANLNY